MEKKLKQDCIALVELKQLSPEKIFVIDVRSAGEYEAQHIPVAINIPLDKLEETASTFDKNKRYVTACGKGGGRSAQAAELLQQIGFNNAKFLCGGTFGWYNNYK